MKIQTGYLYHIKDEFFDDMKAKGLMINHENGHSRPSYLVVKEKNILWFIPLSSKVKKYEPIIAKKIQKYGECRTILIRKIADKKQVILIQNAFPTKEKYNKSMHIVEGNAVSVPQSIRKEIKDNLAYTLLLKRKGLNLFFTDIDGILEKLSTEDLVKN